MKKTTLRMLMTLAVQVVWLMSQTTATGLNAETKLQLAASPAGRIVLHLACAWRDHRFHWHWQGVAREVARP